MTVNLRPLFPKTPNVTAAALSAANTARDGSGVVVTGFVAGSNGSVLDRIVIRNSCPTNTGAANSSTVIRFYLSDTSGVNYRLYREFRVNLIALLATNEGNNYIVPIIGGLLMQSGQKMGCTTSNRALTTADNYHVTFEGFDY